MAGGRRVWIPKKVGETVTIPFDFISDLSTTETLTTASVAASVYSGVDASPSSIVSGLATISGTKVLQTITGGTEGVIYGLLCTVDTDDSQTLNMSTYCAVEPDLP